jgi:serine/threonine protein phosphatase PrpC
MWKIAGAAIIGTSHISSNTECQDKIDYNDESDTICIALADGAGSCKYSGIGAEISCKATIDYLKQKFDLFWRLAEKEVKRTIIHGIMTRLGIEASKLHCDKSELSSTLLFAAIKGNRFIIGHIGDGVICGEKDNALVLLSAPENGEFANTTYFVTSNNYKHHFRIYRGDVSEFSSFYLMSDGASESLFHKKTQKISPVLSSFSQWMESHPIAEVNEALSENIKEYFSKHTTDDCSIIIAHNVTTKR